MAHPLQPRSQRRLWLALVVFAWGVQAIVTQSLLLREALVLMYGSELAWGLVLSAWLFGVAVGALAGGPASRRLKRPDVAVAGLLFALSVAACVELWLFRGARAYLHLSPGSLLSLPATALAALLLVSPVSALIGAAFPLACSAAGSHPQDDRVPAPTTNATGPLPHIYALESAGSLVGGALFSFWAVEHLAPIQTALFCATLTLAATAVLLALTPLPRREPLPPRTEPQALARGCPHPPPGATSSGLPSANRLALPVLLAVLAAGSLLVAGFGGNSLNDRLIQRRWRNIAPGYELCAEAESKYQNLAVGRLAEQYTLYCDGHVSADFPNPYTFIPLAHFWMCQHPAPRRVLLLGGGAEGLLAEILRYPVESVDYVEPDPKVIEVLKPFLPDADRRALDDPRLIVHHTDARHFVKTRQNRFDLVIARLPEPTSALRVRFWTTEFYGELRRAMTAHAALCLSAAAAPTDLSAASATYLASVRATLRRHFPEVIVGWDDPAQVLAATAPDLVSTNPAELADRYARRGVRSDFFDPLWFDYGTDWFDPEKVSARARQLDAARDVEISTDLRPILYVQRLALWEQMTSRPSGQIINWLRSVSLPDLVVVLALLATVTLLAGRVRHRRTTGPPPTEPAPSGAAADALVGRSSPLEPARGASERSSAPPPPLRATARTPWAPAAIILSVASTGFATMALSIIWLFAFQNLYGYVYQRIGWIIALFMGGLVVGCLLFARQAEHSSGRRPPAVADPDATRAAFLARLWHRLIGVDLAIAALALAIPLVLPALANVQNTATALVLVEWAISLLVALTGLLCGAAFALAGGLQLAVNPHAGPSAGSVVGADHAGACLGALLTGILLIPVFGTVTTAVLLAAAKITSAAVLAIVQVRWPPARRSRPPSRVR